MAGHSKWANIKHRKAGQDAKRGKVFTKLIREITVAARLGGGNPADNPRLRAAVDKALGANMPRDTIDRAAARGSGAADADNMEEMAYEGYGPGGAALLVETLTDNRNRTVAAVRHGFNKFGGSLGTSGSVAYLFQRTGVIEMAAGSDEEAVMEAALGAGAHDIESGDDGGDDDCLRVLTSLEAYGPVQDALQAAGLEVAAAGMHMLAGSGVELQPGDADKLLRLVEHLEDLDDVQNVYTNASLPAGPAGPDSPDK